MKLTEKQAWRFLAEEFERFSQGRRRKELTTYGLCYAVRELCSRGQITWTMQRQMTRHLRGIRKISNYWWPPCGRYPSAATGRKFAHFRATIAGFLAAQSEGERCSKSY